jgi:hypothetical protein
VLGFCTPTPRAPIKSSAWPAESKSTGRDYACTCCVPCRAIDDTHQMQLHTCSTAAAEPAAA